jgi:hypothetical protein
MAAARPQVGVRRFGDDLNEQTAMNPLSCHPAQTLVPTRPNPIATQYPATETMLATVEGQGLLRGWPRAGRKALLAAGHAPTNMLLLPPVSEVPACSQLLQQFLQNFVTFYLLQYACVGLQRALNFFLLLLMNRQC